jgi:Arylsulfotransferase (ASST)
VDVPVSRRRALQLIGGAGAGLLVSGCAANAGVRTAAGAGAAGAGATAGARPATADAGPATAGAGPATAGASPTLSGRPSAARRGGVQRFRSRPDLRPSEFVVEHRAAGVADGLILTDCHAGPGQQGPMIVDGNGQLVWFKPLSAHGSRAARAFNLRVQTYRGRPVLTWFHGAALHDHGEGHYELHDQRYRPLTRVHAGNGYQADLHEFRLTASGTALFTCYGQATGTLVANGRSRPVIYWYGVIQEVDVASGEVLFQWRCDEHIRLEASCVPPPINPVGIWDYFHINSIAVDPVDGNLVVSGRNTWAVYKLHRRTGKVIWTLGGKHSDFEMGPGTRFVFQHHAIPRGAGVITIFDNEAGPPAEASQSRGLILSVDERARRAGFLRQFHHRPGLLADALGSVQPLPNGNVLVGWGSAGYVTEYAPDGSVAFDARLAPGTGSYRAFKQPWTGLPAGRPDLAVDRSGRAASVYASWNGATEVTHWDVRGGADPGSLQSLGVAPRQGFETQIRVPHAPRWLTVVALDQAGRALATATPRR